MAPVVLPGGGGGPIVLFTAFEPSGDVHGADVVAALRQLRPDVAVVALGGKRMEAAGAHILVHTANDGAMGLGALSRLREVRAAQAAVREFGLARRVSVHVPVDSPAANTNLAAEFRSRGSRVVHLVAPQMWAWGEGRVKKLRTCTDLVLCLLPFEEEWFKQRQVPARFIGHSTFERPGDPAQWKVGAANLPMGTPRILLLPGSRTIEIKRNAAMLTDAFSELQGRFRGTNGLVCCTNDETARLFEKCVGSVPTGLHIAVTPIDVAAHWCTLALAVSGTVTLDLTRHQRPMVGVYRVGLLSWLGAKFMLRSANRLLPNVVAGRRIVPEFVPCLRPVGRIVEEAAVFLQDSRHAARAEGELHRVCDRFAGHHPAREAAEAILSFIPKAD